MARIGTKLRSLAHDAVAFMCPGCEGMHRVVVSGSVRPLWAYNGDPDHPTFIPSIRVKGSKYLCHSYVTDGRIRFLDDSTHKLAGKTVEIPDLK